MAPKKLPIESHPQPALWPRDPRVRSTAPRVPTRDTNKESLGTLHSCMTLVRDGQTPLPIETTLVATSARALPSLPRLSPPTVRLENRSANRVHRRHKTQSLGLARTLPLGHLSGHGASVLVGG